MDLTKCLNPNDFSYRSRFLQFGYVPDYWSKEIFDDDIQIDEHEMGRWIIENLTGLWAIRYNGEKSRYVNKQIILSFEDPQDHLMFSMMGSFQQFKVL